MKPFIPLGGFQLPFQRRLSRLYNDTKKSSDFVKEPVSQDPEIKAMHRKMKIQKDRLVSWGLEWSDPSNEKEIDESLSKAGLSDLVGSIMSTIKDILAEAEPLWASSRRRLGEKETEGDKKIPIVVWDKARFEGLIQDLTASIDTLHDLSRTRSSAATSARAARSAKSTEELRPFGSTRMQTPQQIDPRTLTSMTPRIAVMSKQAYSDLNTGRQWSPLLLEFAAFDPIYSSTGIMPSMSRFEKLSNGLQSESHRSPGAWIGLPLLLGYYEDMENSRLGLVYQFPATFSSIAPDNLTSIVADNLCTLEDLLSRPAPRLEARFRLAHNLANTVFDMHARGVTHGNLLDSTILFSNKGDEADVRKPLISSFDLFADEGPQVSSTSATLHRHPLDPRTTPDSPLMSIRDSKTLDLYSLAMILVSIGLWTNLENLTSSPSMPESVLDQLGVQCGTLYMRAVQVCWNAVEQELSRQNSSDEILSQVQIRASRNLEACSILDGVSDLDDRIGDVGDPGGRERQPSLAISMSSLAGPSTDFRQPRSTATTPVVHEQRHELPGTNVVSAPAPSTGEPNVPLVELYVLTWVDSKINPSPKLRLYPQIPLPPDAVERWNAIVMPQVNMALKHFCRKHPESIEITLESIGESPQKTMPTVLVVCTSVAKVRSIITKKLGTLFDGPTGFALKVCRGSVVRSRKDFGQTDSNDRDEPANPGFQVRPQNGASIGAWIGDRHLPPVSFGGLISVNDKTYGMTVHHMLDDQDEMQANNPPMRSAAHDYPFEDSDDTSGSEDYACEFSDDESDFSATDLTSDDEDEDEDEEFEEDGDIPGVEPGCGDGYIITQPAFDDVAEGFYPSEETEDEDHLDTYRLGEVYASSGIRRRHESNGYVHEIDWALFEFQQDRFPIVNQVPRLKQQDASPAVHFQPTIVAPLEELPGLEVQCSARTSGLQTGKILPAIASIKLYGRTSMSHTYQVSSKAASDSVPVLGPLSNSAVNTRSIPGVSLGIPGDSGAWVVDRRRGHLCGHVLAFSHKKQIAYISPMDILVKDIAETLEASEVRLGGECVFHRDVDEDLSDLIDDDDEDEAQRRVAIRMKALGADMDKMQLTELKV